MEIKKGRTDCERACRPRTEKTGPVLPADHSFLYRVLSWQELGYKCKIWQASFAHAGDLPRYHGWGEGEATQIIPRGL
eukprot:4960508-Pleurochrysis_carterae.AAC.2